MRRVRARCSAARSSWFLLGSHVVAKRYYISRASCSPTNSAGVPVHDEATADDRLGVVDVDVLAALRARNADVDAVAAGLVQEVHWRGRQSGPPVPPMPERPGDPGKTPSL